MYKIEKNKNCKHEDGQYNDWELLEVGIPTYSEALEKAVNLICLDKYHEGDSRNKYFFSDNDNPGEGFKAVITKY